MTAKKKKKKGARGFAWVLAGVLAVVLSIAVSAGVFLSKNARVNGEFVRTDTQELNLRDAEEVDADALARLTALRKLDLRGTDVDDDTLAEIRAALPECEILWDIAIGESRISPDITRLTLADLPENAENILRLASLRELRVEQCTNPALMAELADKLPECRVSWALGLGGGWFDVTSEELTVPGSVNFAELRDQLAWFENLTALSAPAAELTNEEQRALTNVYSGVAFTWPVAVGEKSVPNDTVALSFAEGEDIDVDALTAALDLLPALTEVDFTDSAVPAEDRLRFREENPELTVSWKVRVFGELYAVDTELLDFSGRAFTQSDLDELEEAIACLPSLQQVDMCNTGLTNELLDELNRKYEDVRIVWEVCFGQNNFYRLRTDATYFRPSEFGVDPPYVTDDDTTTLGYCREMIGLDLGHQMFTDLSFVENMPHLKYLIIAECPIEDITPLSSLQELVYLELFSTNVDNLMPLTKCKALRALNVCYIKCKQDAAWKALSKMTWLEMLWYCNCPLSAAQIRELKANNSALVTFTLPGGESSGGSWRYSSYYYDMRDLFQAWYMPGGTNGVDPENPSTQIIIDDAGTKFYLENYNGAQYWWQLPQYADMHPYIIGITD